MTTELILLFALFVYFVLGGLINLPRTTINESGPRLGARVERHLVTGRGFSSNSKQDQWNLPDDRSVPGFGDGL